ncbi:hypothetical protein P5673_025652 [Acropora cervicornis]|uniref:Uncharacterized protein n=1 Tax=Acropora cervicornis TaxID=6130 RepID=A0AAD9Q241_ACRCE|nr:hypothetical protein P5673_025652 [Acropora cervicornis]
MKAKFASLLKECYYVVEQQVHFIKRDQKLIFDPWSPQSGEVAFPRVPDAIHWNSSIKLRNVGYHHVTAFADVRWYREP